MEFYRAGEALLRSSQPLLPFLAPSAYRRVGATSRHYTPQALRCPHSVRTFASSQFCQQQSSAAARRDDGPPQSSSSTSSASGDDFSALLESYLDGTKDTPTTPTARTSSSSSPSTQQSNPSSRSTAADTNRSSRDDLYIEFMTPPPPSRQPTPTRPSRPTGTLGNIADMMDPLHNAPPSPYTQSSAKDDSALANQPAPIKLNSTVGRTIPVNSDRGMDVGRAFRTLEMACARNSVKRDFMRQRFHERPGLKRKRLKGERWRRRFKEGFRGTVAMVMKMRKQGW